MGGFPFFRNRFNGCGGCGFGGFGSFGGFGGCGCGDGFFGGRGCGCDDRRVSCITAVRSCCIRGGDGFDGGWW